MKHRISGKRDYREWKLETLKEEPCWDCQKAAQNKAAAEAAEAAGLIVLEGTEKQVAWAETIRMDKLREAREARDELLRKADEQEDSAEKRDFVALVHDAFANLETKASASWWIDNRHRSGGSLLRQEARALKEQEATR